MKSLSWISRIAAQYRAVEARARAVVPTRDISLGDIERHIGPTPRLRIAEIARERYSKENFLTAQELNGFSGVTVTAYDPCDPRAIVDYLEERATTKP